METKKYRVKTHKTNEKLVRRYLYIYIYIYIPGGMFDERIIGHWRNFRFVSTAAVAAAGGFVQRVCALSRLISLHLSAMWERYVGFVAGI